MPITVRRARPSDAEALAAFAARTFAETYSDQNSPENMALHLERTYSGSKQLATIADPAVDVLVAEDAGALAGYAQLRTGEAPTCVTSPASIELWRFYVDRPWHGRGVAQLLMAAVAEAARARTARSVWLSVWSRNDRAKAFYSRSGFRQVGTATFVLGTDVQDDWVMELPVRALASAATSEREYV
jgi:ribosomal protein S18 acetylase RimI-like enzyme